MHWAWGWAAKPCLFIQHKALELGKSGFHQGLLLLDVQVGIATSGAGAGRATGVPQLLTCEHVLVDVVLDEEPCPLVLRLVLAPHNVGGLAVFFQLGSKRLVWERIELLNANDG